MEKGVSEFMRLVNTAHDDILNDATKRVSNSLVRRSPVDTGEYLGEWDADVGALPADKENGLGKRASTRRRLQGEAEIGRLHMGDTVFFTNNDPVAERIEFGYSDKAPQGVMRITARQWRKLVRGAARAATNRIRKTID